MVGKDSVTEPHEWLRWLMDHIESQVAFGDTKAGLLLAADAILLVALGSFVTADHPGFASLSGVTKVLLGLSFLALTAALVLGLQTILPNLKNLRAPRSELVNFSWIAHQDRESFVSAARQTRPIELDQHIATVIHGKACLAQRKFKLLYFAARATQVGTVLIFSAAAAEFLGR